MRDYKIYIIHHGKNVSLEEAEQIFLRDNEKVFQDYLKRKAHADFIMQQNQKSRKKT